MVNEKVIGYRIRVTSPTLTNGWFGNAQSYGGECGVFSTVQFAKNSARANGIKKDEYEIWEFYIGLDPKEFFLPEKVFP